MNMIQEVMKRNLTFFVEDGYSYSDIAMILGKVESSQKSLLRAIIEEIEKMKYDDHKLGIGSIYVGYNQALNDLKQLLEDGILDKTG